MANLNICVNVVVGLAVLLVFINESSAEDNAREDHPVRTSPLDSPGRDQSEERIRQMEMALQLLNERLTTQERVITEYKARVADLERTVAKMGVQREQTDDVTNTNSAEDTKIRPLSRKLGQRRGSRALKGAIRQGRVLLNGEGPVAFSASIFALHDKYIGINQTIVFPDVITNIGGGYHYRTGIFTAPKSGIYLFSISITTSYVRDGVITEIIKNGYNQGAALMQGASGVQDQSSVTVVVYLSAGDEVWVKLVNPADASIWGGFLSYFMGCLVQPL